MINEYLNDAKERMSKTADALKRDFATIRAGRANPALLDKIHADYYGAETPINQMSNISVPDPHTILIQPWDKSALKAIEKAILASDLGLTTNNDGVVIRIPVPQLTEERRKELVKVVKKKGEEAKVAVRNIRRDINEELKKLEKGHEFSEDDIARGLDEAQKLTENGIKNLDEIIAAKEADIMEV